MLMHTTVQIYFIAVLQMDLSVDLQNVRFLSKAKKKHENCNG